MTDYRHLLSPGRIGPMELRNRTVMTPMGEDLGEEDGCVSEAQIAYLGERAAGGVGVVMLGSVGVAHPVGCSNPRQTGISEDRFIPGWRRAAERVHAAGGRIAMQLTHAGKNGLQDVLNGRPMWTSSPPGTPTDDPLVRMVTPDEHQRRNEPYTTPTSKVDYRVMTQEDIATVVEQFAAAAQRAVEAGVDGVELHAGHGYLLDGFLSPANNKRSDEYGGSLANRARFLLETLRAMRARVGNDLAIWVRINSMEVGVDGVTLEDAIETARLAEEAGADAIHATAYHDPAVGIGPTSSYMPHQPELLVPNARAIQRAVEVPVIAVGRISPEAADTHIGAGDFQFVAMGRRILADPELPHKLAAGRGADVRPCVHQYRCVGNIFLRKQLRCAANGRTGLESEIQFETAARPRKLLVVGGGPAGLETARIARLRGHPVVLADRGDALGGRWRLSAGAVPTNRDLLDWFEHQMHELDVDVRLGEEVDRAWVEREAPEATIVATGARWSLPTIPGGDAAHVRSVDQLGAWLVDGKPLPAAHVVVLGGDVPGLGLAEKAAAEGLAVTLLSQSGVVGEALGLPGRWRRVFDLQQAGVALATSAQPIAIESDALLYRDAGGEQRARADLVLVTSELAADRTLERELGQAGLEAHAVGDCSEPAYLEGAIRSATLCAMRL